MVLFMPVLCLVISILLAEMQLEEGILKITYHLFLWWILSNLYSEKMNKTNISVPILRYLVLNFPKVKMEIFLTPT